MLVLCSTASPEARDLPPTRASAFVLSSVNVAKTGGIASEDEKQQRKMTLNITNIDDAMMISGSVWN
jgi:hypothetical protein